MNLTNASCIGSPLCNHTLAPDVGNATAEEAGPFHLSTQQVVDLILTVFFFVLGVAGNSLVAWILAFKVKKTDFLIYVLNLTLADLGFCLMLGVSIPTITNGDRWIFGKVLCKADQFLSKVFFYAGPFMVTTISMERGLSVAFPLWYKCHRLERTSLWACGLVWLLSCLLSMPHLIWSTVEKHWCYVTFLDYVKVIVILECVAGFLVPLLLLVSSSGVLIYKVARATHLRSARLYRVVLTTILLFFFCWTPFQICQYLHLAIMERNPLMTQSLASDFAYHSTNLMFIQACANPFIYLLVGGNIRANFRGSLPAIFEKIFKEPTQYKSTSSQQSMVSKDQQSTTSKI